MTESQIREAIAGHRARNTALLADLKEKGVALDVPRPIDHVFVAPHGEAVEMLLQGLRYHGYRVTSSGTAGEPPFRIEVQTFWPPSVVADAQHVENLVRLAAIHDCAYDGWGTLL